MTLFIKTRIYLAALAAILLQSCSNNREDSKPIVNAAPFVMQEKAMPVKEQTLSKQIPHVEKIKQINQPQLSVTFKKTNVSGIQLLWVVFDDRTHQLRVADQPDGPGTRWSSARELAAATNSLAAINGGFFTPEGTPLGLVITYGSKRGYVNRSSLGSGIYLTRRDKSIILRREQFLKSESAWKPEHLLQTGPMLLENGKPTSGLSKQNSRVRSFLLWDGAHYWAFGQSSPCTLDDLASALSNTKISGVSISTALNLDGGRSCDMFVSSSLSSGGVSLRSFLAKPVRNFLFLVPRQ